MKDTLLFLVNGHDVLHVGSDGALHVVHVSTQVRYLSLLATQQKQQLLLQLGIHLQAQRHKGHLEMEIPLLPWRRLSSELVSSLESLSDPHDTQIK